MNMRRLAIAAFLILVFSITGCTALKIRLFPSQADPLREFTLEGKSEPKILVVPIRGVISNAPKEGFVSTRPSIVQEVVSQLRRAEEDEEIKAILDGIDKAGLSDNTLIICTTDHGPGFPDMKKTLKDRGTGVMLILRGPESTGFSGGAI